LAESGISWADAVSGVSPACAWERLSPAHTHYTSCGLNWRIDAEYRWRALRWS
jgi:hypothetical protein